MTVTIRHNINFTGRKKLIEDRDFSITIANKHGDISTTNLDKNNIVKIIFLSDIKTYKSTGVIQLILRCKELFWTKHFNLGAVGEVEIESPIEHTIDDRPNNAIEVSVFISNETTGALLGDYDAIKETPINKGKTYDLDQVIKYKPSEDQEAPWISCDIINPASNDPSIIYINKEVTDSIKNPQVLVSTDRFQRTHWIMIVEHIVDVMIEKILSTATAQDPDHLFMKLLLENIEPANQLEHWQKILFLYTEKDFSYDNLEKLKTELDNISGDPDSLRDYWKTRKTTLIKTISKYFNNNYKNTEVFLDSFGITAGESDESDE